MRLKDDWMGMLRQDMRPDDTAFYRGHFTGIIKNDLYQVFLPRINLTVFASLVVPIGSNKVLSKEYLAEVNKSFVPLVVFLQRDYTDPTIMGFISKMASEDNKISYEKTVNYAPKSEIAQSHENGNISLVNKQSSFTAQVKEDHLAVSTLDNDAIEEVALANKVIDIVGDLINIIKSAPYIASQIGSPVVVSPTLLADLAAIENKLSSIKSQQLKVEK